MTPLTLYFGDGRPRPQTIEQLRDCAVDLAALQDPEFYLAGPDLRAAVTTALLLGMPLLLTGEPDSGKSRLAASLARELGLEPVLEFVVKSDTQARDLLYRYDAVARFHAGQAEGRPADPRRFMTFTAIGRALLYAKPPAFAADTLHLPARPLNHPGRPQRSVVLIDEIDKAPRDVPNDLLTEIEQMCFTLPELAGEGEPIPSVALTTPEERANRPIVIITSNSERALPEAFLRRCVYHHLEFPPFACDLGDPPPPGRITVEAICASRLGRRFPGGAGHTLLSEALSLWRYLRSPAAGLARAPSLAEALGWLAGLSPLPGQGPQPKCLADLDPDWFLAHTRDLLFKNQPDQARAGDLIAQWRRVGTGAG